jgi:hypothetical protein
MTTLKIKTINNHIQILINQKELNFYQDKENIIIHYIYDIIKIKKNEESDILLYHCSCGNDIMELFCNEVYSCDGTIINPLQERICKKCITTKEDKYNPLYICQRIDCIYNSYGTCNNREMCFFSKYSSEHSQILYKKTRKLKN